MSNLKTLLTAIGFATLCSSAHAQLNIDWGDDDSLWAMDGECDDMRFIGNGMAPEPLDPDDVLNDATDCRTAYADGTIRRRTADDPDPSTMDADEEFESFLQALSEDTRDEVDFGDDDSMFSEDGECDDPRFIGAGMASPPLLEEDASHDASDCRTAFEAGTIRVRTADDPPADSSVGDIDFEEFANTLEETLGEGSDIDTSLYDAPPANGIMFNGVNFGDDTSTFANDGECDDSRFEGEGITSTTLLESDAYHDASDCLAAWKQGGLRLRE